MIIMSLDQGSSGVCGTVAFEYRSHCNSIKMPDFSHGGHKDFQCAVKDIGLWDWLLPFMIPANANHGPNRDDQRRQELRDAMSLAYQRVTENTPMFSEQAIYIHEKLTNARFEFPHVLSPQREACEACEEAFHFSKKRSRLNMKPFRGVVQAAEEEVLPS